MGYDRAPIRLAAQIPHVPVGTGIQFSLLDVHGKSSLGVNASRCPAVPVECPARLYPGPRPKAPVLCHCSCYPDAPSCAGTTTGRESGMSELSRDDVVAIVGPVGDAAVAEIIATGITKDVLIAA